MDFLPTVNMISYNIDRRVEKTRELNIDSIKGIFYIKITVFFEMN